MCSSQEQLDRAETRLKEEMEEHQSTELKYRETDVEHRSLKLKLQQLQEEVEDLTAKLQSERDEKALKNSALQNQLKTNQLLQDEASKALSQQSHLASLLKTADGSKGALEEKLTSLVETNTQLEVSQT